MTIPETNAQQFTTSGGWPALNFCNTADGDLRGEWEENLHSYADLVAWAEQQMMISPAAASRLREAAANAPEAAQAALERAYALRMTLYRLFSASASEMPADRETLSDFDRALKEAAAHLSLRPVDVHYHLELALPGEEFDEVAWAVVWSAAQLLASDRLALVHECAGESCTWLFLDTTRNHSRRWCDMKGCGNRAKARAFYRRKTAKPS
jgi:predicted RNA-binding Zn ribbon-like protein